MKIEMMAVDRVIPYARNPRQNAGAVDKVAASLQEYGWQQPIVVDKELVVIVGHTRLLAAKKLGMAEVPVQVASGLTPAQVKAYRIADNKVGEYAEWDDQLLSLEIKELKDAGFDLALTGFEGDELDELMAAEAGGLEEGADPDDAPGLPERAITVPGELVILGRHKLLCGDSTDAAAWDKLMGDDRADLVWTDPPYGVAYVGKTKNALTIANDAMGIGELTEFLRKSLGQMARLCREGASWYVAAPHGPPFAAFGIVLGELGIWRQTLIWVKQTFALGRSDYHYRHEAIFYGWKPGAAHYYVDDRTQDTVSEEAHPYPERYEGRVVELGPIDPSGDTMPVTRVTGPLAPTTGGTPRRLALLTPLAPSQGLQDDVLLYDKPARNAEHPTMKPTALIVRALENSSHPGQIVTDGFGGSGSTLIACEATGRVARLMELDPKYCDVIVERWENATGKRAIRHTPKGTALRNSPAAGSRPAAGGEGGDAPDEPLPVDAQARGGKGVADVNRVQGTYTGGRSAKSTKGKRAA